MKLNTKNNVIIITIILLLSSYHFFIHNGLEKLFSQTYFDYNDIRRPLAICDKEINCTKLYCTGMPSGHAEGSSVLSFLLYFYKIIPLWVCLTIICITSAQRVITYKHTIFQILVGFILGFIYAIVYKKLNLSIYGFLIVFSIGLILTLLNIYKIDQQVYGPIPSWVDKSMMSSIKKKQDSPLFIKFGSLYTNAVIQNRTFINWTQLENYLDIIVNRIKKSGQHYDAIVGIKTGGAIISDYISLKLGIPNYKVKLSREEYNCDKKANNTIDDMIKKNFYYKQGEFTICEGINDNLEGKNIILIYEIVATGKTMEETYNYLKNVKQVNEIYTTSVAFYKLKYNGSLDINYVLNGAVLIWPWGYDN
jgi:hypoxanthine phosphoribosyltransferase